MIIIKIFTISIDNFVKLTYFRYMAATDLCAEMLKQNV